VLVVRRARTARESGDGVSAEDGPFGIAGSDLEFTVDWATGAHTAESTPLTANGPGARALARVQKNTDVHDAILDAMRLGRDR
jgi:alkaline phosphatase